MTRINCIPVDELTDKHLLAEYRELPRVFKLARICYDAPNEYTLGAGHVKFFYNKLCFICKRFHEIIDEMQYRGFNPNFKNIPDYVFETPLSLWNNWTPTEEAMRLNRERIAQRLQESKIRKQTKIREQENVNSRIS